MRTFLIPLCSLLLAAPAALAQHRVVLVDGRSLSGEVQEATLEKVVLQSSRGQQEVAARDVLDIQFAGGPDTLGQAQEFLASLDFQNAVNSLEAAAQVSDPAWVPAVASLRKAEALLSWARFDSGQAAEAVSAFQDWTATFNDHFHVPRARTGLARAMTLAGKVDEAAKELEDLASLAFEKDLGPHVELGARLARCHVYLTGGQAQVAETRLRDLVPTIQTRMASGDTAAALRPILANLHAQAQIALGDAVEAKDGAAAARVYWQRLADDPGTAGDVRAAANIGLARAADAAGRAREAQLLLAKVVATMPASPEIAARALYRLAEVSRSLQDRPAASKPYYQRVVDEYPTTTWAIEARAKLSS